jgi:hypothetical protein
VGTSTHGLPPWGYLMSLLWSSVMLQTSDTGHWQHRTCSVSRFKPETAIVLRLLFVRMNAAPPPSSSLPFQQPEGVSVSWIPQGHSDTPPQSRWLHEPGRLKGGSIVPKLSPQPPQGPKVSSRGAAPPGNRPTPSPPSPLPATRGEGCGRRGEGSPSVGSAHGYSCCSPAGSMERSNLFGSHWSNQWLAQAVTRARSSA